MSSRTHSVVVEPDRWLRSTTELARLLAPVTGTEVDALAAALDRGPMTVEADLSQSDANDLLQRLEQMGVPAAVRSPGLTATGEAPGIKAIAPNKGPVPDEPPDKPDRRTMIGMRPISRDSDEGWGALFPDLAEPSSEASVPSLDELEKEPEAAPPSLVPDKLRDTLPPTELTDLDDNEEIPPAVQDPGRGHSETPTLSRPTSGIETTPPLTAPTLVADEVRTTPTKPPPARPARFDGAVISNLVADDEDRPPYAPTGFDPRPDHVAQVAAFLSALAPGAGQVFNGDDDEALDYGLKFWLIKPWIDAVRDAYRKGEKIRTHWAPRPEDGAFLRSMRYLVAWWVAVALSATALVWVGARGWEATHRDRSDGIGARAIAEAKTDAMTKVLAARVKGLDAVLEAQKKANPDPQFTMSDKERAKRLFAIGYRECSLNHYSMCEAMMKRVVQLRPTDGAAIKLQAWASLNRTGGRTKLPDIGKVESLSQLELREYRQEMALQGEELPPPPKEIDAGGAPPAAQKKAPQPAFNNAQQGTTR